MIILILFHLEFGNRLYGRESCAASRAAQREHWRCPTNNLGPVLLRMCDAHRGPKESICT